MKIEEIKQQKFKTAHQKAVINVLYTANWIENRQQEFFKTFGITAQQFNILRILKGKHPDSLFASEIKSQMIDRSSDVSRLIGRLILKKLITKKISRLDKRAVNIFITKTGLALLKKIDLKQKGGDKILYLTEAEVKTLSDLLDKGRGS